MKKEILLSGLLGAIVIFAWLAVSTGPLPLSGNIADPLPDDKEIHTVLKENITEPGVYYLPSHPEQDQDTYPEYGNEPLFSVIYGGRTPDTFMGKLIFELFCIFAAPIIAASLLSVASARILAKYSRRVLFVMGLGLLLAVFGEPFSDKPVNKIMLSSINSLITWALVGLVLAWRIKPTGKGGVTAAPSTAR